MTKPVLFWKPIPLVAKDGAMKRLELEARLAGQNIYQDHCFTLKLSSFIQILLVKKLGPLVYLSETFFCRISPKRIFPRECLR